MKISPGCCHIWSEIIYGNDTPSAFLFARVCLHTLYTVLIVNIFIWNSVSVCFTHAQIFILFLCIVCAYVRSIYSLTMNLALYVITSCIVAAFVMFLLEQLNYDSPLCILSTIQITVAVLLECPLQSHLGRLVSTVIRCHSSYILSWLIQYDPKKVLCSFLLKIFKQFSVNPTAFINSRQGSADLE